MQTAELSKQAQDMLFFVIRHVLLHSQAVDAEVQAIAGYYNVDARTLESVDNDHGRALAELVDHGILQYRHVGPRMSYWVTEWLETCMALAADVARAKVYEGLADLGIENRGVLWEKVNTFPQPYLDPESHR